MQNTKKSILAVVVGILVTIIVTMLVDMILHATGVYPPMEAAAPLDDRLSLIASSYRFVITVGAASLTAILAPWKPMKHALIMGVVGTVLGLVGVVATWGKGMGPAWYPVSLAVLAIPECALGGWLWARRER